MKNTCKVEHTHLICPKCKHAGPCVDHLNAPLRDLAWYCDHCGFRYAFELNSKREVVKLRLTGEYAEKRLVLLRHGNVGLIVQGCAYFGKDPAKEAEDEVDNTRFFYNEHACPANFMPSVRAVIDLSSDDVDPHGIFAFIDTLPWDDRITEPDEEFLKSMVPRFSGSTEQDADEA